jgi:hypothetical protein
MNICSIKGDIAELAPEIAELSVLWIRSGLNRRYTTWEFGLRMRYPGLTPLGKWETVAGKPWLARLWFFARSRDSPIFVARHHFAI